MIAPQFTPGPWRAVRIKDPQTNQPYCTLYQTWVDVQSESGATICGIWANQGARMADANLIAAAPDLYAALNELLLYGNPPNPAEGDTEQERGEREYRAVMMSLAALAKARGEVQP